MYASLNILYSYRYYAETGIGVKIDVDEAKTWYLRAAGAILFQSAQRNADLWRPALQRLVTSEQCRDCRS